MLCGRDVCARCVTIEGDDRPEDPAAHPDQGDEHRGRHGHPELPAPGQVPEHAQGGDLHQVQGDDEDDRREGRLGQVAEDAGQPQQHGDGDPARTSIASWVWVPDLSETAVLVGEPSTTKEDPRPFTMFATPRPVRSRFGVVGVVMLDGERARGGHALRDAAPAE